MDEEAYEKRKAMIERYEESRDVEENEKAICEPLPRAVLTKLMGKVFEVDERGFYERRELDEREQRDVKRIQAAIVSVDERRRENVLERVASSLWGMEFKSARMSLSQKITAIALLKRASNLDTSIIAEAVKGAVRDQKLETPGLSWMSRDIAKMKTKELLHMKVEDIIKAPTVWKDYVLASKETGLNRNILIKALQDKYRDPLRERRSDRVMLSMLHEVEEILWLIEALVTPNEDLDRVMPARNLHEILLLRMRERLETIYTFVKHGSIAATIFQKKAREDGPSRDKDLDTMQENAVKEARKQHPVAASSAEYRAIIHRKDPPARERKKEPEEAAGHERFFSRTVSAPPSRSFPSARNPFPPGKGGARGYR